MSRHVLTRILAALVAFTSLSTTPAHAAILRGEVVDADTNELLPCRIYLSGEDGKWYFPRSATRKGSAFAYKKQNWANEASVEMHTTLSAHPFRVDLKPGRYQVTVARGKEYFPLTRSVVVGTESVRLRLALKRWINMASLGWYSGDTHVHRTLEELPNVQFAEDLNVSFPLLYWVTHAFRPPGTGDKSTGRRIKPELITIDETHVIYPLNTEYEIFSVGDKSHTLGAFFILNHQSVFQQGVPPVAPIAERARREGALLELDKHNWPWSMMLVPVMDVDLYELTNNHLWRTEFAFSQFGETPPDYMNVEMNEKGFTERGWIEYGLQNYYTLLNCGYHLRPTAGTASGVHPVPLGFGRVYVKLPRGFDYEDWMAGLDAGRSFVTTGPMLFATLDGHDPGHRFQRAAADGPAAFTAAGSVQSAHPLDRIEIVVNGQITHTIPPQNAKTVSGACLSEFTRKIEIGGSAWVAMRCFAKTPQGRPCFAHTAPFHIEVPETPLRPRQEEVAFLIKRMTEQIDRNKNVLPEAAIQEYRQALDRYERIMRDVR